MRKFIQTFFVLIILLVPANSIQAQLVINEVQSSNTSTSIDRQTPDWVEIYNPGTSAVNLSGYYLTDNISTPTKWLFQSPSPNVPSVIAPGEYLVVLANDEPATVFDDYYQTNFRLSSSGEEVHLFDASVNPVSSLVFPALQQNESYGYNSENEIGIFSESTLGAANGSANFRLSEEILATPSVSLSHQIFTSPQLATIESEAPGTVYYTLDGTTPTESSPVYSGPFSVSDTTVVKSIVVQSETAKSRVGMRTLLFNKTHDLPVISITSENFERFGSGVSQKPELDGRVWIEMIESDGTLRISQYADYTASGANSNSVPPMNGKVRAKEKYGVDHFENTAGAIFPNKPHIDEVSGFLIRNSSQDWGGARLRDAFAAALIAEGNLIDFGFQDYRPVVAYVNGEYQGVLSIREDDDADFLKNNYPGQATVEFGQNELFKMVRSTEVANTADRDALLQTVDMKDYYFYLFHYNFLDGSEVAEYGYQVAGEKADWVVHDEDITFGNHSLGSSLSIPSSYFVSRIEQHEPFRNDLIQSWCAYANFLYDSDRAVAILDNFESAIESEMADTIQFHKDFIAERGLTSSFFDHAESVDQWKAEVDLIRNIVTPRLDQMHSDFMAKYDLDAPVDFVVTSSDMNEGSVRVQGVKLREESRTGRFFKDMPIELIAEPNEGSEFSHWEGLSTATSQSISVTLTEASQITAVFESIVPVLLGDVNRDGVVDFLDIPAFITVLSSGGFQAEADCDQNGVVDFADIPAFIGILISL